MNNSGGGIRTAAGRAVGCVARNNAGPGFDIGAGGLALDCLAEGNRGAGFQVSGALFDDMEQRTLAEMPADKQDEILRLLRQLRDNEGKPDFIAAYQGFIAGIADHLAVYAPFIPALTRMLGG